MKIHVVGGGGREHAICWKLAKHGHEVSCAPGNPGIAQVAHCEPSVKADDVDGQIKLALARGVDLVVVGPEAPLVIGLADAARAKGLVVFGPSQAGARLEGSKAYAKQFFARHGVPTSPFSICESMREVDAALQKLGDDVVVKADGLAAGKGVTVCDSAAEAREVAARMIEGGIFGAAGRRVVIEKKIRGREASIFAITDGERFVVLPAVEDHKAVFDGDKGPNTGGMGTVSPTSSVGAELIERVRREVLVPTVRGLAEDGVTYRGVLFAGLMIDEATGTPYMLEYNCRFGDPETEPLMVRWSGDPAPWLYGAAQGRLPGEEPDFSADAAVCVVMAAPGYPEAPKTGGAIRGVAEAGVLPGVVVFHAGTSTAADGTLLTAGGRVLAVTASGDDLSVARARAYQAVGKIGWEGAHFRRDIGARGHVISCSVE
jgi:phosphoribosylamine--glycine ligase